MVTGRSEQEKNRVSRSRVAEIISPVQQTGGRAPEEKNGFAPKIDSEDVPLPKLLFLWYVVTLKQDLNSVFARLRMQTGKHVVLNNMHRQRTITRDKPEHG